MPYSHNVVNLDIIKYKIYSKYFLRKINRKNVQYFKNVISTFCFNKYSFHVIRNWRVCDKFGRALLIDVSKLHRLCYGQRRTIFRALRHVFCEVRM